MFMCLFSPGVSQVQKKKRAKKFRIKNFGAPKTPPPPLKILYVGVFPVF